MRRRPIQYNCETSVVALRGAPRPQTSKLVANWTPATKEVRGKKGLSNEVESRAPMGPGSMHGIAPEADMRLSFLVQNAWS